MSDEAQKSMGITWMPLHAALRAEAKKAASTWDMLNRKRYFYRNRLSYDLEPDHFEGFTGGWISANRTDRRET
jgi:hypothetical protein